MKKSGYSLACLCVLTLCRSPVEQNPLSECVTDNAPIIVCLGTSLTYGYRASCYALGTCDESSYPANLAENICARVITEGLIEGRAEDGHADIPNVKSHNPGLVLVEFGGNELLQDDTSSLPAFAENLEAIILALQADSIRVALLCLADSSMADSLKPGHPYYEKRDFIYGCHAVHVSLSRRYGIALVSGFLRNIFDDSDLMTMDDMHPSRDGYRAIADTIRRSLDSSFRDIGAVP